MRPIVLANRIMVVGILTPPFCFTATGFIWLWLGLAAVWVVVAFVAFIDLLWNGL